MRQLHVLNGEPEREAGRGSTVTGHFEAASIRNDGLRSVEGRMALEAVRSLTGVIDVVVLVMDDTVQLRKFSSSAIQRGDHQGSVMCQ